MHRRIWRRDAVAHGVKACLVAGLVILLLPGCGGGDQSAMAPALDDGMASTESSDPEESVGGTAGAEAPDASADEVAGIPSEQVPASELEPTIAVEPFRSIRGSSAPQSPQAFSGAGPLRSAESDVNLRMGDPEEVADLDDPLAAEPLDLSGVPDSQPLASETSQGVEAEEPAGAYDMVRVFYATDRNALDGQAAPRAPAALFPVLAILIGFTFLLTVLAWRGRARRRCLVLATCSLLVTCGLGAFWAQHAISRAHSSAFAGVEYGDERGTLVYGTCDVSIPASHVTGELERPSLLRLEVREDVAEHVVLHAALQSEEEEFFERLRLRVAEAERPEVFVFVHGYNVTFAGAARRTAQIAHDVQFTGAPIFFSWPSQGGLLQYTVDANNVEWAVPHLRQFLLDVTQRSGASAVNLIAHSMGNRALTSALRELQLQLGSETALFNQIILAAPDIDAEIFRRDLAPALVRSARHVTLYASSHDQALVASKKVHGYPRAGDSGAGLVVLPGIETIDVSQLDTSLLGHSYYGSSDPILLDIRQLVHDALPASRRPRLVPRAYGDLTYWVFEKVHEAVTGDLRSRLQ